MAGSEAPATEATPRPKLKVQRRADNDRFPSAAAVPPAETKNLQEPVGGQSARQDASSPEALRSFAAGEAAAPVDKPVLEKETEAPILLQMEEQGASVRLTRDGDLQLEAPEYSCRIRIDMKGVILPEPADAAASRDLLLRLVRERYRAALERKCGPLPEPLAAP